jgi:hypothetical protein
MEKTRKIEYAKLLGFDAVTDQIAEGVDFSDETIGAKLGAKVGADSEPGPSGAEIGRQRADAKSGD